MLGLRAWGFFLTVVFLNIEFSLFWRPRFWYCKSSKVVPSGALLLSKTLARAFRQVAQTVAALRPAFHQVHFRTLCRKRKECGTRRFFGNAMGTNRVWYHHASRDVNRGTLRIAERVRRPHVLAAFVTG